jgi:methionyl aminopeptidase
MTADSQKDIESLKAIGRVCAEALRKMMGATRAGMTTRELDEVGRLFLEAEGARSAPQVAYNYPAATCISVSPVIAHGIPDEHVLREGELIHIDVSAELDGYYADTGASLVVSKRERNLERLLEATKSTLAKALRVAKSGNPLNGIGRTVQTEARKRGYNVIYDLTGHGIGRPGDRAFPHHGYRTHCAGRRWLVPPHHGSGHCRAVRAYDRCHQR